MESIMDLQTLVAGLKNNTVTFSADKPVHVCFNSDMSLLNSEPLPEREGLIDIQAKAYHDGVNLNGSKIECGTFREKSSTLHMRPILANVVSDEDGHKDFGAHDRAYSFDEEGNLVEEIIEKPIGCIESVWFEEDPGANVTRAIVRGCLWQDYAQDAVEILDERGQVDCSVELSIKAMRFEEDTLILDDYFVMGLTLLGKDFEAGMAGSTASTKAFATDPQKKDEDDQELLDVVEEEEAEALKKQQEEEERQRQEEEERLQAGDADAGQDSPGVISTEPVKTPKESKAKEEPKEETAEDKKAPEEEDKDVSVNALILADYNLVFSADKDSHIFMSSYSGDPKNPVAGELTEVVFVTYDQLQRANQDSQELKEYKYKEVLAAKEAILNDPLYAELRESEEFKKIAAQLADLSLDEVDHKCLAAFAKFQKEERVQSPYTLKTFGSQNVKPVKDAWLNDRYGEIFNR